MATQTATRPAKSAGGVTALSDADDKPGAVDDKKGKKGKNAKGDKAAKGGKKKKIILVVIVLVVGLAGYKMLGPKGKPPKPGPPKPGVVVALTDTTLNLTEGHFLKVKIALQTVVGAPADLDTSDAADLLITEFSGQTMATLSTTPGRDKLKAELLTKIEAAYPKQIMGIYFTEFVMQ